MFELSLLRRLIEIEARCLAVGCVAPWGSENWTSYLNGQKLSDHRMVQYSNGGLNTKYHLNTGQVKVPYLDVSFIQMFIIQIPTVVS